MNKRVLLQPIVFLFLFIITLKTVDDPYLNGYLNELKASAIPVVNENDELYKKIDQAAKKYEEAPEDAVIDKVWKKIPGYNGLKVDRQASYQKMKGNGFNKNDLVFKEVKPDVQLDDLAPAPIFRGNPNKPMVAFLINVAWGNEYIPDMLKVMNKHNVKGMFFLDGSWVKDNQNLAMMIAEEGHEIGNHGYSHKDMATLSREGIESEIRKTNEAIDAALGIKPQLFAPPSGSYNDQVVNIADNLGLETLMWTADTVDWKEPPPMQMVDRVLTNVENGTMILMHPTNATAEGIEQLIVQIKEKGYRIGTAGELLKEKRILTGMP